MATADEVTVLDVMDAYRAYGETVGELSAAAQAAEEAAKRAMDDGDADMLLEASVNMRSALAGFDGAALMMAKLGLNPEVKLEMEVTRDAEGQR